MTGVTHERYGWSRWSRLGRPVYPGGPHRLRERFFFPGHPTGGGHAGFGPDPTPGWVRVGRTLVVGSIDPPRWERLRPGGVPWVGVWAARLAGTLRHPR